MITSLPPRFEERLAAFRSAEKVVPKRYRWHFRSHPDYAKLNAKVHVLSDLALEGRLIITAHILRDPPKYGFTLLFQSVCILRLDVNPARWHTNRKPRIPISCTHWQTWPERNVVPDGRDLPFVNWLDEFVKAANITPTTHIRPPPRGKQLELDLWPS